MVRPPCPPQRAELDDDLVKTPYGPFSSTLAQKILRLASLRRLLFHERQKMDTIIRERLEREYEALLADSEIPGDVQTAIQQNPFKSYHENINTNSYDSPQVGLGSMLEGMGMIGDSLGILVTELENRVRKFFALFRRHH